jgi:hypothetical protein
MRTTITIQDSLLKRAKRKAAQENCTLGDVVNDALRYRLVECVNSSGAVEEERPLKVYGSSGLQAGVDLSHNASLGDTMDEL